MQVDGHTGDSVLNGGDQIVSLLGTHDTGHVLNADGGSAHFLQFLDHLHILSVSVDRRGGVGDSTGSDSACIDGGFHGNLQIIHIVQRVEDTDDVNAVLNSLLNKQLHEIIGIVGVTQNILAAQQHLQLGARHLGADLAQTLPGIFVQVAQADIKGSAAPALGGVETGLVDGLEHGLELFEGQTGRDQRLVRVTQNGLNKLYFLSHYK